MPFIGYQGRGRWRGGEGGGGSGAQRTYRVAELAVDGASKTGEGEGGIGRVRHQAVRVDENDRQVHTHDPPASSSRAPDHAQN